MILCYEKCKYIALNKLPCSATSWGGKRFPPVPKLGGTCPLPPDSYAYGHWIGASIAPLCLNFLEAEWTLWGGRDDHWGGRTEHWGGRGPPRKYTNRHRCNGPPSSPGPLITRAPSSNELVGSTGPLSTRAPGKNGPPGHGPLVSNGPSGSTGPVAPRSRDPKQERAPLQPGPPGSSGPLVGRAPGSNG